MHCAPTNQSTVVTMKLDEFKWIEPIRQEHFASECPFAKRIRHLLPYPSPQTKSDPCSCLAMYRLAVISLLFLGLLCYRIEGSKTTNTIFNGTTDANVMTYDVGQDRPNWVRSWLANWLVKRSSPFTRVSDKSREAATNLSTIVARPSRNLPMNALMSSFVYSLSMVPILLAITSVFSPIPHGKLHCAHKVNYGYVWPMFQIFFPRILWSPKAGACQWVAHL